MRMPDVLDLADFDDAELAAMRLDGDVLRLGDTAVPIGVPITAKVRAASIRFEARAYRLVAELSTAAWVHGVLAVPPRPHRFCSDVTVERRTRMQAGVREVRLLRDELVDLGGLRVTTPLRTAWDLARLEPERTADATLLGLLDLAGLTPAEASARLAARDPRLPHQRRAVARLTALPH